MIEEVKKLNEAELAYSVEERKLYHMNCAEILLLAANEKYNLNLDERFIKAVCPYGGGLYTENTCGSLLGAIASIGVMYTEDKPSENLKMKDLTKKFVQEFYEEFGSLDCKYIKEHHRSETEGCNPVKIRTAQVFERVVNGDK